jgi:alkylation response protein AidB-like acyl-CoA dehydrogenase
MYGPSLSEAAAELQERARRFTDEVLIPLELEAEANDGRLPQEAIERVKREAVEAHLNGGLHDPEYGGQGWSLSEWAVVAEQFGRCTNAIHWHVPDAYNVWAQASPEQCERYLRPALRGELRDAYAVTERDAGSDPSRIASTAEPTAEGYVLNGEKWFVTTGDVASVLIVMANLLEGERRLPTLFLVDADAEGVRIVDNPRFTHSYPDGHPTISLSSVEVTADAVIGGVGNGESVQRSWFTQERLGIATHGIGAMSRLLHETVDWALQREQGGGRIFDYQGVSFPLADSAVEAAAGRLLTMEVARLSDDEADPKLVHAKASMAKLFVSEAAWRCADRCVQVFGGRGYMRSNVAERFLRELRVDRIWEGTSEIQRLIVARGLERRGVARMLH